MLFYLSLLAFLSLLGMLTYRYRALVVPHLPDRIKSFFPRLHNYTPLSTFSQQAGLGMTSSNFDIEANIHEGDSRTGLDEQGTQEVLEIMRRERINFDQARLVRHNRILARNGIDPTGSCLL
ncbi:hypothetical protein BJ912DRAFT_948947 [Pholiota molesta]|nr:hypothetical protein BJ912DRAFT_948947 [Pholiota molesta]